MAKKMAAAEPRTLAAALMDQAQRTFAGMMCSSLLKPEGKGMPMANPGGAMSSTEMSTLSANGSPTPPSVTGGDDEREQYDGCDDGDHDDAEPVDLAEPKPLAEETAKAAREQHGEDDDRQCVSRMAQKQDELLDERYLDEDIAGTDTQEENQRANGSRFGTANDGPTVREATQGSPTWRRC